MNRMLIQTAFACLPMLLAAPAGAVSVIRGPYLQLQTPNSIHVVWLTDILCTGDVEWGTTTGYGQITASSPFGTRHEIELEPLLCFRMKALGYLHPEWGQGVWKGELAVGGESWKCDDVAPLALENLHIQQVMRAHWGDRVGVGVLEQLAVGPHAPSGFKEFLDGGK